MFSLITRIEDLRGLHVRVHLVAGKGAVSYVDGVCQGVENDGLILAPSSLGERAKVSLQDIATVTQLPGEFPEEARSDQ